MGDHSERLRSLPQRFRCLTRLTVPLRRVLRFGNSSQRSVGPASAGVVKIPVQVQEMGDSATGSTQCEDRQQPADAENGRQPTGMINNQNGVQRAATVNAEGMVPS